VGDAIATLDVLSGATGPRIAAFTADRAQAMSSLTRLEGIDAALVLPGHGQPWSGGLSAAVAAARAAG
jgi:glyoxylase-like metal-dependent hydrolase (beta-lactamase superfamily II)